MAIPVNWLSREIIEICDSENRLKALQVKASLLSIDEDCLTLTEKTEILMVVPSIIRALRIVLQERKLDRFS